MRRVLLISVAFVVALSRVANAITPDPRVIVVISDLHLGPGMTGVNAPYEDFRWPNALGVFLKTLNSRFDPAAQGIDLVIAGDLMELWQHPTIPCVTGDRDHGCKIDEIDQVVTNTLAAHAVELKALGDFAASNKNRLFIIPGNHDAALTIDSVWAKVRGSFGGVSDVTLVKDGRWVSDRVVVEHGHQIGHDLNRFPSWPNVVASLRGTDYLWRPWGESFVQNQFNEVEKNYPLIDNVLPLTAGLKLYFDEHSVAHDVKDAARFLAFNIFQTSWRQKLALHTSPSEATDGNTWNVQQARALGWKLVAAATPDDDPDRALLMSSQEPRWKEIRDSLDQQLADTELLDDAEINAYCDAAAALAATARQGAPVHEQCNATLLVAGIEKLVPEKRLLSAYLSAIQASHPRMRLFVYGHTHQSVAQFPIRLKNSIFVKVINDGAFQRLTTLDTLLALQKQPAGQPAEHSSVLQTKLTSLPPCYSLAVVSFAAGVASSHLWAWVMDEKDSQGSFWVADSGTPAPCVLRTLK